MSFQWKPASPLQAGR